MAVTKWDLVRTIRTRDEHGTPRRVFVYQSVFHDGTSENPGIEVRGPETPLVEDGRAVTALDDGTHRIDISGEILVPDEADTV
jgi:hypothetical protein